VCVSALECVLVIPFDTWCVLWPRTAHSQILIVESEQL